MNGCQFARSMNIAPAAITIRSTAILVTTIAPFTDAASLTPTISSAVTSTVTTIAGTLRTAVTGSPPVTWTAVPGAALNAGGNERPSWPSRVTRIPDQP